MAKNANEIESDQAERAYGKVSEIWAAEGDEGLDTPRVNLALVVSRTLQITEALRTSDALAGFAALAKVPGARGTLDPKCPEKLELCAQALWHVRTRYLSAEARKATVALDPALVASATALRGTMFRVVGYHCVDHANADDPVKADLEDIKTVHGQRYLDMATDLSRLADYYRDDRWQEAFRADARNVKITDAAEADRLASTILRALRKGEDEGAKWLLELQRGWAAFVALYDQCRRGAAFLYWPAGEGVVPPLGTMRSKRAGGGPAEPEPAPEPAPEG